MSQALERLHDVERMTSEQVLKLMANCLDDFNAHRITAKESSALLKAANKRLSAIRRERARRGRRADQNESSNARKSA